MGKDIVFISGANRGIGLEFARQLAVRGDEVVAGYRDTGRSEELLKMTEEKSNLHAVRVEVTEKDDVHNLKDFIADKFGRLDLVINNAGINIKYSTPIDEIEPDDIMENFRVNIIGPFLAGKILRPLLARGRKPRLVNITSQMGSVSRSSGDATPYRISKAALNMLSKNQSIAYRRDNIVTVVMHPGWVKTDMGGPGAPLMPETAVSNMLRVIDNLAPEQNGAFLAHDGRILDY